MVKIYEDLAYPDGLAAMQTAHHMASAILQRDPTTHEHADRLAGIVMKLFNDGMLDVKAIARKAADLEAAICGVKPPPDDEKLSRIRQRRRRLPFH
ncbi:hypothetical protein [Candidatus Phyllobacterium onerii]|uniref:hypothetical protein n=1 Tax=Candidatus Phyllobacterium onerii TaxID=3020828 RepID=UPI00232C1074|nr:hypothetical protein [Phyllobacterium sp. IY22]